MTETQFRVKRPGVFALVGLLLVLAACSAIRGDGGQKGESDWLDPIATSTLSLSKQDVGATLIPASVGGETLSATDVAKATLLPSLPAATATPTPADASLGYGMQIHGCGYPVEPALDLLAAAGFDWVKQQVRWEEIEPEYGLPQWDCIDQVVDGAEARGLHVLLSVTTSPAWSRPWQERGRPEVLALLGEFCLRMVERYRGRVDAVEVFNEPNLDREWGGRLDPLAYAGLLEWTYYAIRQADPDVIVISAGLAPTQWNDWATAVDDREYLRQMADAGAGRFADCIGVHFNHGTSSPLEPGGEFERQMLDYYTAFDRQLPLCLTEFGFATPDRTGGRLPPGFEWAATTSAEEQAQWLVDGFEWAGDHPEVIRLVVVWNLNYHADDADDPNVPYALWSPKGLMPAYSALRDMDKPAAKDGGDGTD
ncbi:MAG: cellulase family glycosylhydrolase [Anaerolineae bacterium]|nr:cellulase family glycosylhydrolase [Anaerolineae bacterium]